MLPRQPLTYFLNKMFDINSYMINKMGWMSYSEHRGIGLTVKDQIVYTLFEEDPYVRFFFDNKEDKKLYVIKEFTDKEKQKSNNLYKFIQVDYNSKLKKPKFKIFEFKNNSELFKLIINTESCKEEYIRHFRINKLLYR